MKFFLIIIMFLAMNCSTVKKSNQNTNVYYFYFEKDNNRMKSYYNYQKNTKSYWYEVERADKILFLVKKSKNEFKIKKIKAKDTIGLNVKSYEWLNQFDNSSRLRFFGMKPKKQFYIIEKDSLGNKLNLLEVDFVDEIE